MRPYRIVIADDDPGLRMLLQTILELEADFEVVGAVGTGAAALEVVERTAAAGATPDGVLLDKTLPDMDGIVVAQALRRFPELAVVVHTGHPADDVRSSLEAAGVAAWIEKGAPPRVLVDRLREACADAGTRLSGPSCS